MKKKKVACALVAMFLSFSATIGYADTIGDKKNELKDVNQKIEDTKKGISKIKTEQDKIISEIAKIEVDLKEKEEQIAVIEKSLKSLRKSIEEATVELEEAMERERLHKELMDERICAMYMSSGMSNTEIISIMLESKSITDFLDRLAMIREIIELDKQVFDKMQSITAEVEEKKKALEAERDVEEGTKEYIASQKALIEEKHNEKESLFAQLKEKREKMEKELGNLERTSGNLESTIRRLVAERAERERREREQAANQSPSRGGGSSRDESPNEGGHTNVSGGGSAAVSIALQYKGRPYVYGGNGPSAFDCSGLTSYVYRKLGVTGMPRTAAGQANWGRGTRINSKGALKPGDLVFFYNGSGIGHTGIYIGGSQFIHAQNKKTGVIISPLNSGAYARRFAWGRRILK